MWYTSLLENNKIPDGIIRSQIRKLLKKRLFDEDKGGVEDNQKYLIGLIDEFSASPIAVHTEEANTQHYEVPTEFYQYCLGSNLKYSSGYWNEGVNNLDKSEEDMLELTCHRAELSNGQEVLELGCGWGSLSLYMSSKYPQSNFTVVSNSATQKLHIDSEARLRGINNLTVITSDMNSFTIDKSFDRVVSVEMFEHMRNHYKLLENISGWLKQDGRLFVHIFTHKDFTYKFEAKDETDWMSKYFFTGGIMPSDSYLFYFNRHLNIEKHWRVSGIHYQKTSEAWLSKMDSNKNLIMPLFKKTYGKDQAMKWWVYWRIFFMSCAELWGYKQGNEWFVSHYLFRKNQNGLS